MAQVMAPIECPPAEVQSQPVSIQRWRFTTDEYLKMGQCGIFVAEDRVELIDGDVCRMSPIGTRHIATVGFFDRRLNRMVGDAALVFVQSPVILNDYSEPEPDVMVVKWREDEYASAKPCPADVLLLIEVADSSLEYDRSEKLPRYAAAGIPEVWILDLDENRRVIEQYSLPNAGQYATQVIHKVGDKIVSTMLPELIQFTLAEVFRWDVTPSEKRKSK